MEEDKDARMCGDLKIVRLPSWFRMKTHKENRVIIEKRPQQGKLDLLPKDLKLEIMYRLCGKSLTKLRCLSKSWSSIIRNQDFIDSFFSMSLKRPRFVIAFSNSMFAKDQHNRLFIFTTSPEGDESSSSSLVANLDITIPSITMVHDSKCWSVRGFVTYCNSVDFKICNPSTGKVINFHCRGALTSLGYDPIENEFKVLSVVLPPMCGIRFVEHEVITLRNGSPYRRNVVISPPYSPIGTGICINGFLYSCAYAPQLRTTPVIVCFDVRNESISFIATPNDKFMFWATATILIDYKGKLASVIPSSYLHGPFDMFDLWILEDVEKQYWSKQTFSLPTPLAHCTSQGLNSVGEIVFAPTMLPYQAEQFYIFYYNLERRDMRRVGIHGIADTEEFRSSYGLNFRSPCCVSVSPQHIDTIASL